jgi:LEA14-like dessication related protein
MRKSLVVLFFITVLSISLLAGCSQSQEVPGGGIDLVPETANMIGHLELDQIIEDGDISGMYGALPKETGDPQTVEEALAASMGMAGLDLSDFEEAWVFGDVSQTADNASYLGAILKGGYDESALLADMESGMGEGFTSIDCEGYKVYTDSDQKTGLALLTSDLAVAGSMQAVRDVIAVREGDKPCIGGDLLDTYEGLDDALVKAAVAVPEGLVEQSLQGQDASILLLSMMDTFSAVQTVTMTMAKEGESVVCNSQILFADSESAEGMKSMIQMAPTMMGSIEMPGGPPGENQQEVLTLMAALLGKSESSVSGTSLAVSFDVTAADIEAAFPEEPGEQDGPNVSPSGLAVDVAVSAGSLTASGLDMSVDATITNHTAMTFDTGDLKLTAAGGTGQTYIQTTVSGASVAANSSATFQNTVSIPLEILKEADLRITVDTTAGSAGISVPLSASVTLTLPSIESLVAVPGIDLTVDIGDLTSDGLDMSLQAVISNANPFALEMGDLQTAVTSQSGNVITSSTMQGCSIAGNSAGTLSGHLLMPLDVLNESSLVITVQTQAGFAGVTLPISARITVNMPDIGSLIAVPGMDMTVDIGDLTSDGLDMSLQAVVSNANPFALEIGDLQATVTGGAGNVITSSTMQGCSVAGDSTGTLSGHLLMPLDVLNESSLVITVQTQAGFAGVILPISARITVNMPDIESLIAVPGMDLTVDIGDLSSAGLDMSLRAVITNANPFALEVGDLKTTVKGQSGNVITSSTMKGCSIGGNSTGTLSGHLLMPLDVLNESSLVITVQTQAGFAGVTLPISARITVNMPDLGSLLATPGIEVYTEASWVPRFPLPDLRLTVSSVLANNASLDLSIGDIRVSVFDANGNLVAEMTVAGGEIEASSSRTFAGSLTLSSSQYAKLLAGDYFVVKMATEAGISGVNATIPLEAVMTVAMSSLF